MPVFRALRERRYRGGFLPGRRVPLGRPGSFRTRRGERGSRRSVSCGFDEGHVPGPRDFSQYHGPPAEISRPPRLDGKLTLRPARERYRSPPRGAALQRIQQTTAQLDKFPDIFLRKHGAGISSGGVVCEKSRGTWHVALIEPQRRRSGRTARSPRPRTKSYPGPSQGTRRPGRNRPVRPFREVHEEEPASSLS